MALLSIAVQHHPSRADLLSRLVSALTPLAAQIIFDPDPTAKPSSWRTYRRALETTPAWATHRVVVQDDALPCTGLSSLLRGAVAARPDALLVLCVCAQQTLVAREQLAASDRGDSWISMRRYPIQYVQTIGLVWPVKWIAPALAWIDQQPWPAEFTADDEIVGRVVRALEIPALAAVPSLLEHEDVVPSLFRSDYGNNPGRRAALFHRDPGLIDWSQGPVA